MAYNGSLPELTGFVPDGITQIKENFRAIKDDKIVDPKNHASRHGSAGDDPITPASIGLGSTTDGSSGADSIGSTAITGVTGTTVQSQHESIVSTFMYRPPRNRILNGCFSFWQRGTSSTDAEAYLADQWKYQSTGDGGTVAAITQSREAFDLGQTDVPMWCPYFWRVTNTTQGSTLGNGSYHRLAQGIEYVMTLQGRAVTLSFYAKSSISNKVIAAEIVQNFGTGGTPSAEVVAGAGKFTLTSSWQKCTLTCTLPSVSGKTLGSDGNNYVGVRFWFQNGSTYNTNVGGGANLTWQGTGTIDISLVQLEEGSVANPFEARFFDMELGYCERFFQKSYNIETAPGTASGVGRVISNTSGTTCRIYVPLKRRMRANPTISIYSNNSGSSGYVYQSTAPVTDIAATAVTSESSFHITFTGVDQTIVSAQWTADATLF